MELPNIKTLNSRIRRILNTFGADAVYTNVMYNLNSIEGLKLTDSGLYISESNKDPMALKAALANIPTLTKIYKDTFMEDEDLDGESYKDISKSELVIRANLQATVYGAYEASLTAFYNHEPSLDDFSVASIEWTELHNKLLHPSRKLTETEVEYNKKIIQEYLKGKRL